MNQRDKTPTIIGSKELVDFPELGFVRVPAKIDTGADSSSIWASDITEQDGKLEFYLFDEQSPYYTGQKVSTDIRMPMADPGIRLAIAKFINAG